MTEEPTEAHIKEACEILGIDPMSYFYPDPGYVTTSSRIRVEGIANYIAQRDADQAKAKAEHEAFRQQVSEEMKKARYWAGGHATLKPLIEQFIQPDPEPTPAEVLEESLRVAIWTSNGHPPLSVVLAQELDKRGVELRFKDRSHEG